MKAKLITATCTAVAVAGFIAAAPLAQAGLFTKNSANAATTEATKEDAKTSSAASFRSPNFKRLDANSDDKLSKEEYLKDQLDAFVSRDENKDGFLSADENDFPPNTPPEMKVRMREQMMEDEKRRKEMEAEMEKRRAEDMKRMEEERAKREAEQKAEAEKAAKEAATKAAKEEKAPAAKTEPLKEEKAPAAKTEAPKEEKPAENPVEKPVEEPTSE